MWYDWFAGVTTTKICATATPTARIAKVVQPGVSTSSREQSGSVTATAAATTSQEIDGRGDGETRASPPLSDHVLTPRLDAARAHGARALLTGAYGAAGVAAPPASSWPARSAAS